MSNSRSTIPSTVSSQDAPSAEARILLADDSDDMRTLIAMRLRQNGYAVTECRNGAELLAELKDYLQPPAQVKKPQGHVDLIISDIRMPGVFGTSVVEAAAEYPNFPPTILITAFGDDRTHAEARRFGARAVLDKPFDLNVLLEKVREVLSGPPIA
jgi:two-component system, response regulator, stage 0 sporulation protein F